MNCNKLFLALLFLSFSSFSFGQFPGPESSTTWNGGHDTDWGDYRNWSPRVPTSNDNVIIPNTTTDPIISTQTAVCKNLILEDRGELNINGGTLQVNGNLTVGEDADKSAVLNISGGVTSITGDLVTNFKANITLSGGTLNVATNWNSDGSGGSAGGILFLTGGTFDIEGDVKTIYSPNISCDVDGTNFNLGGDFDADGTYWNFTNGTITFDGTSTQTVGGQNTLAFKNLIISKSSAVTINVSTTISGAFTIQSDGSNSGSLKVTDSGSTGTVSYERYITGGSEWHLIASPVVGQDIGDFITDVANKIAFNSPKYALANYSETGNVWNSFCESSEPGTFPSGFGYEVLRSESGTVVFAGSVLTTDASLSITRVSNGWNILGNPYPSAINATSTADGTNNLLSINSADFDPSFGALYIWEHSSSSYKTISNSGGTLAQNYLQVGQGFFVKSKTGGSTFDITEEMQSHQSNVAYKSSPTTWPSIKLLVDSDENRSSTLITFNHAMTRGLDVTYDAGMFKSNPDYSLYSRLVEDNGVDFAIQCLPLDFENLVIPIGIDMIEGEVLSFYANTDNLPEDCSCYLEDRNARTFTDLKASGTSYSVTANSDNIGIGNFFIHTSPKTLGIDPNETVNNTIKVITNRDEGYLRIMGFVNPQAKISVYDMAGRLIMSDELKNNYENIVQLPELEHGIYLIRIQNAESR